MPAQHDIIINIYRLFNERNIDAILVWMAEDVHWPNGWEGGYVEGHAAVRDYWTRQWEAINPTVEPIHFKQLENGRLEVMVDQLVKAMNGDIIFKGSLKHIYSFEKDLIKSMEIVNLP